MRRLVLALLLLFVTSECSGAGRSACPAFKIGTYGGGTELWYATYCDGPQFTTLVLQSPGAPVACASPLPLGCVGGLAGGKVAKVHPKVHKGYENGGAKFPHSHVITDSGLSSNGTEAWFVKVDDKGNAPSFAKVVRVSYPSQTVTYPLPGGGSRTETIGAFKAVFGFEVASVPTGVTAIDGYPIDKATNAKNVGVYAFPISESEAIIADILMMK